MPRSPTAVPYRLPHEVQRATLKFFQHVLEQSEVSNSQPHVWITGSRSLNVPCASEFYPYAMQDFLRVLGDKSRYTPHVFHGGAEGPDSWLGFAARQTHAVEHVYFPNGKLDVTWDGAPFGLPPRATWKPLKEPESFEDFYERNRALVDDVVQYEKDMPCAFSIGLVFLDDASDSRGTHYTRDYARKLGLSPYVLQLNTAHWIVGGTEPAGL